MRHFVSRAALCVVLGFAAAAKPMTTPPVATPSLTLNHDHVPIGSPRQADLQVRRRARMRHSTTTTGSSSTCSIRRASSCGPTIICRCRPRSGSRGRTVEYTRTVFVPNYPYIGEASVRLGIYDTASGNRLTLSAPEVSRKEYLVAKFQLQPQSENIFLIYKDGWHPAEVATENPTTEWQWTKKAATISFRNPKKDSTFYLEYDARTDQFTPPQQVTLRIGDQVIGHLRGRQPRRKLLTFPLTAAQLGAGDMAELMLDVDRTFTPGGRRYARARHPGLPRVRRAEVGSVAGRVGLRYTSRTVSGVREKLDCSDSGQIRRPDGRLAVPMNSKRPRRSDPGFARQWPFQRRAEIVFLTSGGRFGEGPRVDGDRIILTLRGGGEVTCDEALIEKILPDEVPYPEPTAAEADRRTPAAAEQASPLDRRPTARSSPAHVRGARRRSAAGAGAHPGRVRTTGPAARSPKGAMGLMQLMPSTARDYKVRNPFDPKANIEAGIKHLKSLIDRFGESSSRWRPTTPAKARWRGSTASRPTARRGITSAAFWRSPASSNLAPLRTTKQVPPGPPGLTRGSDQNSQPAGFLCLSSRGTRRSGGVTGI